MANVKKILKWTGIGFNILGTGMIAGAELFMADTSQDDDIEKDEVVEVVDIDEE